MKKHILLIGAGKSSPYLIDYLLKEAIHKNYLFTIIDRLLPTWLTENPLIYHATTLVIDVADAAARKPFIQQADVVISMLPAFMHPIVAQDCLEYGKHFFTASYISEELKELEPVLQQKGLFFLQECGLDPGLDHLSAMKIIDELHAKNAVITSFTSYCGGLVAPEYIDNPFGYKFSWNPRNVITAGKNTATYLQNNRLRYVPYHQLFKNAVPITVVDYGNYEGYPNRDSLNYQKIYGLHKVETMIRGTIRADGYCEAWNIFVQMGLTDESVVLENANQYTYKEWLQCFLPIKFTEADFLEKLKQYYQISPTTWQKIESTGLVSDTPITLTKGTPADILQELLERKWKLKDTDKDLIVLVHHFEYTIENVLYKTESTLVLKGENAIYTAMAKTVGLPLAIAVDLFLQGTWHDKKGLFLPIEKAIYIPILQELAKQGISLVESTHTL